jgi:hypothetical protein
METWGKNKQTWKENMWTKPEKKKKKIRWNRKMFKT